MRQKNGTSRIPAVVDVGLCATTTIQRADALPAGLDALPPKIAAASDRRLNYYQGVALVLENNEWEVAEKALSTYIETVPDNSEVPAHSSAYEYLGKLSTKIEARLTWHSSSISGDRCLIPRTRRA